MLKRHLLRLLAWFSQTINLWFLFGHHDQTISARCYVNRHKRGWGRAYRTINALFWWMDDHCKSSFERDVEFAKEVLAVDNQISVTDSVIGASK